MADVSNREDLIDSRDVISRIEELEDTIGDDDTDKEAREEARDELKILKELADEASGYAPDWLYGSTLIRDSYFKEYAMELAEDIGAIPRDLGWPATCIDWDQAARDLQIDYSEIDFAGVSYWIR